MKRGTTQGDGSSLAGAATRYYDELHEMARHLLNRWPAGGELDPRELIHEAYLRLVAQEQVCWQDRAAFLRGASAMMHRILVNHRVARNRIKRGGKCNRLAMDTATLIASGDGIECLVVREALHQLAILHPRRARVVEFRCLGGLTNEEIAAELRVCPRTVEREWRDARNWLCERLGGA